MKGLKLTFGDVGISLELSESVEAVQCVVQNALVNIGTVKGTDNTFADKGTDLLINSVRNGIPSVNQAQHYANFAAIDTLFFSRETDLVTNDDSLQQVLMTPASLSRNNAQFDVQFETLDGRTFGVNNTIDLNN
jgi:hypothetical protein